MNRLFVLLLLAGSIAVIPAVIGAGHLVPAPQSARADACGDDGTYPNCATQCALTGEDCDISSDGDVDWGWVCASTGNDCPSSDDSSGDSGGGDSGSMKPSILRYKCACL